MAGQLSGSNEDYFNPSVQTDPGGNFLHYSRGIEAPEAEQFTSTSALGVKGLTDMFGLTNEAVDTNIKEDIKQQVQNPGGIVDQARDNDMANLAQKQAPTGPAADAINTKVTTMQQLDAARKSGKVSETSYWMQLEAASRQLREQYAGHRDYIDQMFSQMTGHQPANALQASLRQDAQAAAGGAGKQQEFIESAAKEGKIPNNMLARMQTENVPFDQIVYAVSKSARDTANVAALNAAATNAKDNQELADTHRQQALGTELNGAFSNNLPNDLNEYYAHVEKLNKGGYSREDLDQIHQQADGLINHITNQVQQVQLKYAGILPADKIKAMTDGYMNMIPAIKDSIDNPTSGLASWMTTANKAQEAMVEKPMLMNEAYAKGINLMKALTPNGFFAILQKQDQDRAKGTPSAYDAWTSLISKALVSDSVDGKSSNSQNTDKLVTGGINNPEDFKNYIDLHKEIITNPKADPTARANVIKSIYADDGPFMKNVDTSSRDSKGNVKIPENIKTFSTLTTPQIAKSIYDTHDPASIGAYEGFVTKGTNITASQSIADIQQDVRKGVKMEWDPGSNQFKVADTGQPHSATSYYNPDVADAKDRVTTLNKSIQPMIDMLERRGSKDLGGDVLKMLGPMGLTNLTPQTQEMMKAGAMAPGKYGPVMPDDLPRLNETMHIGNQHGTVAGLQREFDEAFEGMKARPGDPDAQRYAQTVFKMLQQAKDQDGVTPVPMEATNTNGIAPGILGAGDIMKAGAGDVPMDANNDNPPGKNVIPFPKQEGAKSPTGFDPDAARKVGFSEEHIKQIQDAIAEGPKVNDDLTVKQMQDSAMKYAKEDSTGFKALSTGQAKSIAKDFGIEVKGDLLGDAEKTWLKEVKLAAKAYANNPADYELAAHLRMTINGAKGRIEAINTNRDVRGSVPPSTPGVRGTVEADGGITPTNIPDQNTTGGTINSNKIEKDNE